jgi:hypothetical protein
MMAALMAATGSVTPLRQAPATAHRFVRYYSAIQNSGQTLSFWDRVTYGLILAGSQAGPG